MVALVVVVFKFPVVVGALEKPLNMSVVEVGNGISNITPDGAVVVVALAGLTRYKAPVVAIGAATGEAAAAVTTAGAVVVTVTVAVVVVAPPNIGMVDWPPNMGAAEAPDGRAGTAVLLLGVVAAGSPVDSPAIALKTSCACDCTGGGESFKVDGAVVAGFGTKENV